MQKKPKKRWLDVQIILASLAVTFTVGLWNVFAMGNRQVSSSTGSPPVNPPPSDPTLTYTYTPSPTAAVTQDPNAVITLPKVHILMGGSLPVVRVVPAAPPPSSVSGSQSGGSSGGGASNPLPPPPPATNTSSSKP